MSTPASWTAVEWEGMADVFDEAAGENFKSTRDVVNRLMAHYARSSPVGTNLRTRSAIGHKLLDISGKLLKDKEQLKTQRLLEGWDLYKQDFRKLTPQILATACNENKRTRGKDSPRLGPSKSARLETSHPSTAPKYNDDSDEHEMWPEDTEAEEDEDVDAESAADDRCTAEVGAEPIEVGDDTIDQQVLLTETGAIEPDGQRSVLSIGKQARVTQLPPDTQVSTRVGTGIVENAGQATQATETRPWISPVQQRLLDLLALPNHGGYDAAMSGNQIWLRFDKVFLHMDTAIELAVSIYPTERITDSQISPDLNELGQLIFAQQHGVDAEENLQQFLDMSGTTVKVQLRIFAAAAVYQWVFNGFSDIVTNETHVERSPWLNQLISGIPGAAATVKAQEMVRYLEEGVRSELPAQAKSDQHRFHDMFMNLRGVFSPQERQGNHLSAEHAHLTQKNLKYKSKTLQAFKEAYGLRLDLEKTEMRPTFAFPRQGDAYNMKTMRSANTADPKAHGELVAACLSPAIFVQERKVRSEKSVIVPALVLLQGYQTHNPLTSVPQPVKQT